MIIQNLNGEVILEVEGNSLRGADLSKANLREADLSAADLSKANLSGADLSAADLREANLSGADLREANLSGADLSKANLSGANLRWANLSGADLYRANLSGADLYRANLSGAKGLLDPLDWIQANFKQTDEGYVVFKAIGNTVYPAPEAWVIEVGAVLTEVCHWGRTLDCGCGVNFGTLDYIRKEYPNSDHWECLLAFEDLINTCVPLNTDGKARCGRLTLIKKIN